jgi:hypothetical protein
MERALASGGDLDGVGRTRALCVISALLFAEGEAKGTAEFAGKAVEQASTAGDEEVLALATMLSGLAAMYLGDLSSAQDILARALAMGRERARRLPRAAPSRGARRMARSVDDPSAPGWGGHRPGGGRQATRRG